jgi:hypothetical protein
MKAWHSPRLWRPAIPVAVAAEALAPWRRVITPALGGLVAGALLWWARRIAKGKKQPDYLEAIVIGDGHQDVRGRRCIYAHYLRRCSARSARGRPRSCAMAWLVTTHRLCSDRHGYVSGRHYARAVDVLLNNLRDDARVSTGAGADAGQPHCLPRLPCDPP